MLDLEICEDIPARLTQSPNLKSTGIVLAGGASRRMGRDKAFLELDGRTLIEVVVERMARVCAEVLVVASDARPYAGLGAQLVEDRFHGVGVLGGLHAGLEAAAYELTLAVGCDMPFLNPDLLRAFAGWAEGFDVAVLRHEPPPRDAARFDVAVLRHEPPPRDAEGFDVAVLRHEPPPRDAGGTEGGLFIEPLHGAYRRTCLPAMETAIRARQRRIISFFPHVRVRYVATEEVAPFDPDLRSFRNVNTHQEWEAVRAEWRQGRAGQRLGAVVE